MDVQDQSSLIAEPVINFQYKNRELVYLLISVHFTWSLHFWLPMPKGRPITRNISTQHTAAVLRTTRCTRLATWLHHATTCNILQQCGQTRGTC